MLGERGGERQSFIVETLIGAVNRRSVASAIVAHLGLACLLQIAASIGKRHRANHECRPLHPMRKFTQVIEVTERKSPASILQVMLVRVLHRFGKCGRLLAKCVELPLVKGRLGAFRHG